MLSIKIVMPLICVLLILQTFSVGQIPPNYYSEHQAASKDANRRKLKSNLKILKRKFRLKNANRDELRQSIVSILIQLDSTPTTIMKAIGKGFDKPSRDILLNTAKYFATRGEKLEDAEDFLQLVNKIPRRYVGGNGGQIDCRKETAKFLIDFHRRKYQKIIVQHQNYTKFVEANKFSVVQVAWCSYDPYYVGLAYFRIGRLEDALKIFLNMRNRHIEKNGKYRIDLEKIFRERYGSIVGLQEIIDKNNQKWKTDAYVLPNLINVPYTGFSLRNADESLVKNTDFVDKIIVVRVFYTDQYILPFFEGLESLQQKYKEDVVFIAIEASVQKSLEIRKSSLNHYLRRFSPSFPVLFSSSLSEVKNINPNEQMLFVIDSVGNLRFKDSGGYEKLDAQLSYLIKSLKNSK